MTTRYLIDHGAPDNRWQVMLRESDRLLLLDTYATRAQARAAVKARLAEERAHASEDENAARLGHAFGFAPWTRQP